MTTEEPKSSKLGGWQFSLRMLLGLVVFVAVGCVGLSNPSFFWRACINSATLAILLIATIAAVFCKGKTRAFTAVFAIVGWSYLAIPAMTYLYVFYVPHQLLSMIWVGFEASLKARVGGDAYENFFSIGHHLWALLFALLGGLVARYFYSTRADEK